MSLSAHLLEPGDHGRLPFHPDCPVCRRDRLAGRTSTEPVVPLRVQAALAAGVLALSAGSPVSALAAEPDRDQEGLAPPEARDPQDPAPDPDPDFDPGGDDTDTPAGDNDGEPPAGAGDEDVGPAEQPPAIVRDPVLKDPEVEPVPTPGAPAGALAPPSQPSAPQAPPLESTQPEGDAKSKERGKAKQRRGGARQRAREVARKLAQRTRPSLSPAPAAPAAAPAGRSAPAVEPGPGADASTGPPAGAPVKVAQGADSYVVRSGDSLWSIASALLDDGASAAQIAREVNRLWQLNAERIGTGDPDLIMPGQTLRLR